MFAVVMVSERQEKVHSRVVDALGVYNSVSRDRLQTLHKTSTKVSYAVCNTTPDVSH
jgi:hypothetical protein